MVVQWASSVLEGSRAAAPPVSWDGVSNVCRANKQHLRQVKGYILAAAVIMAGPQYKRFRTWETCHETKDETCQTWNWSWNWNPSVIQASSLKMSKTFRKLPLFTDPFPPSSPAPPRSRAPGKGRETPSFAPGPGPPTRHSKGHHLGCGGKVRENVANSMDLYGFVSYSL